VGFLWFVVKTALVNGLQCPHGIITKKVKEQLAKAAKNTIDDLSSSSDDGS
jgi:hypothetical protein